MARVHENSMAAYRKDRLSRAATRAAECEPRFNLTQSISEKRSRGDSFSSIAAWLNEQGLRGRNGARWYSASVREYLRKHSSMLNEQDK